MAKKIQLQDVNGNVLHPLTLGECVTMSNGENLDTLMSKSQMFTPTITQDKSMFKVGTGVDVDYSANVKDGAYESLVFKGKSLVNLLTKTIDTTWNLNLENWSIVSTTLSDCVLKPNTTYSVIVYVTEKTCPDRDDLLWVGDVDGKKDKVTHDIVSKNVSLGANVFVINTVPDFSSITSAYRGGINFQGSKFVEGTLKWKAIVLEGDWTNKELPPYFTGLCDVKMPILQNVGKNLFDINQSYDHAYSLPEKYFVENNKLHFINVGTHRNLCWWIKVNKGEKIYCSCLEENNKGSMDVRFFSEKRVGVDFINRNSWQCNGTINSTICSDEWMLLMLNTSTDSGDFVFGNINVSYHGTGYEDYKTNILRTPEEIVLREVGGVCDTYNPLTGEYVRHTGGIVLDGSQQINRDGDLFYYILQDAPENNSNISDRLPSISVGQIVDGVTGVGVQDRGTNGRLYINIDNLSTGEEITQYLRNTPVTVQYRLSKPITTIIKPSTMTPFAYQNGHVIVESGHEGQSLLPEIEYSVVTGRTGQVTQNTKVLRKQEQQIVGLEELLLTQVVQMEYERTLLQFDYELQMMMLG